MYLYRCTDWGEMWYGGVSMPNFTHRCNVSPLRGKKTQNCPLSNLNTGASRFALRAMLPVKILVKLTQIV